MLLYRCSNHKCHRRCAMRKALERYRRAPRCKGCRGTRWKRDRWQEQDNLNRTCQCGAYHFPHKRGSKWCIHAVDKVTLAEAAERWGGELIDYVFANEHDPRIGRSSPTHSLIDDVPF